MQIVKSPAFGMNGCEICKPNICKCHALNERKDGLVGGTPEVALPRLEDLSLWFIEKGPIREMIEAEFETALFRVEAEASRRVEREELVALHDGIVTLLFYYVLEQSRYIRRDGELYVLSSEGQKELQTEALRRIREELVVPLSMSVSGSPDLDIPLHPPSVLKMLRKYLFPRSPSP
jgi:hypothetical protein